MDELPEATVASCTCRPGDPLATCAAYLAASADPTPTTEADDA